MPSLPRLPDRPPPEFGGVFRTDDLARAVYAEAAGIARVLPRGVAVPRDANDVAALVRWAHREGVPLVPRGSGSSMPGGAIGDGVILDLSRLRRIGPVNVTERAIAVEAGLLRGEVDRAARERGLRFPVDPSSGAFCTVGGMASTNAAGAHSLAFGATRRWVRSLRCVFDDGSIALVRRGASPPREVPAVARFLDDGHPRIVAAEELSRTRHPGVRKESSGYATAEYARSYELVDLLVGSEGTLAVFLEIELDLIPTAGATSSVLGAFDTLDEAVEAAVRAREAGAVACELLDRTFLDIARAGGTTDVPPGVEAVLLSEVEGETTEQAANAARAIAKTFERAGATTVRLALDAPTESELWDLRHAASPILSRLDPALRSMQFIEDAAVPPERLADYVRGVRDSLAGNGIRGVIFGHAGDAHVHVNPLIDVSAPDWRRRMARVLDEVTELVARLGGTVAGEHGDGRLRTPLLDRVWTDEARARFALVKHCFDPGGIFNPGVKVPLAGEHALETIKYDPSLSPLPRAARAALNRVEGERAYARSRLDLLAEASEPMPVTSRG